jgi:uncharacterized repeat protein (TIGR01451 family)
MPLQRARRLVGGLAVLPLAAYAAAAGAAPASPTPPDSCSPTPVPLQVAKTVDLPVAAGDEDVTYTITITNANCSDVPLERVADTMHLGFIYEPGTTTGDITSDPAITFDRRLKTWSAPGSVPAGGSFSFSFSVIVPVVEQPRSFEDHAVVVAPEPFGVTRTGQTTPIHVIHQPG